MNTAVNSHSARETLQKRAGALLSGYVEQGKIPGISALVIHKGEPLLNEQWGYADKDSGTPITAQTIFRIHSLTKPLTAVAFLQLYEQGLVRMDTPIEEYLPVFGNMTVLRTDKVVQSKRPILTGHLLTMTAGFSYGAFPDVDPLDHLYAERGANLNTPLELIPVEEFFEELAQFPLAFQPGESWRYGFCYDVLGHIIEQISGLNLEDYFKHHILDPLDMKETGFFVPLSQRERVSALYRQAEQEREEIFPIGEPTALRRPPFCMGGSGLYSTIEDYSRFCHMLLNAGSGGGTQVMGRKTAEMMLRNHLTDESLIHYQQKYPGCGYGLGLRVLIDPARSGINSSVGEFGWDGWSGVWLSVDPSEQLISLLMMQQIPGARYPVHREFQQIVNASIP